MRKTATVLALSLMLPSAALATPTSLSIAQLDLITAGISATVHAEALASGSISVARTKGNTLSGDGPFVGIAVGHSAAFGAGTDDAQTRVGASAEGGRVKVTPHSFKNTSPLAVVSFSSKFVIAIDK